ncbi:MAG: chemotaxis protein CheA [Opitutales bacterium]
MSQPDPAQTFLLEADDLLAEIEETAIALDPAAPDAEAVNKLFRQFHTIKGSGAIFGFERVAAFTHHVETALDAVRSGRLGVTADLLRLLLAAADQIRALLLASPAGPIEGEAAHLMESLGALTESESASPPTPRREVSPGGDERWRIRFRPAPGVTAQGLDPAALLDELRLLGECVVRLDATAVPALGQLDPEQCHLAWEIELTTDKGRNAIEDTFIFVADESELEITSLGPASAAPSAASSAASSANHPASSAAGLLDSTVRVGSTKLDRLVHLVGELVMNQSRLTQVAARLRDSELAAPVEEIERLVAELRDGVLDIRMMPIGSTFRRFKRLVHDLSSELGKEVDLVTEGAETEVDKTVLDQLADPLTHLIRNSLDHAIEEPAARAADGKARTGRIRLAAAHEGSQVVITITDDGRGLDAAAIRAKAVEKGLIAADAVLGDREIFNLIFLPGFSTARALTSVSGRGVGMDAVRRQIEALRGTIELESRAGEGTTVRLRLPLTLAIIDGMLVQLGTDRFIVPMAAVAENVELTRAEREGKNGRNVVPVRGELVPYIRLREYFGTPGESPEIEKVVIARWQGQRVGLVVDRILGSHQTVIQSLGRLYRGIRVCSGATIMGDGGVALIFALDGLVELAARSGDLLPEGGTRRSA